MSNDIAVISKGLNEGDKVIIQGAQRVRNGMVVNPHPAPPAEG